MWLALVISRAVFQVGYSLFDASPNGSETDVLVALLAVVVTIILTPGFHNVLLSLLAAVYSPLFEVDNVESLESNIAILYISGHQ